MRRLRPVKSGLSVYTSNPRAEARREFFTLRPKPRRRGINFGILDAIDRFSTYALIFTEEHRDDVMTAAAIRLECEYLVPTI